MNVCMYVPAGYLQEESGRECILHSSTELLSSTNMQHQPLVVASITMTCVILHRRHKRYHSHLAPEHPYQELDPCIRAKRKRWIWQTTEKEKPRSSQTAEGHPVGLLHLQMLNAMNNALRFSPAFQGQGYPMH